MTGATRAEAHQLEESSKGLAASITDLAEDAGSALIAGALEEFHNEYVGKVTQLACYRVHNVANEGDKVISEWRSADEEMARAAIREMDTVPTSAEEAR